MRLTPLDIRKQEFKKSMRGLDPEEVHAFLTTIADEYEAVLNDNKALRERLLELDDKVQEYRNMEKTLRDTLLTAERVTVESKDNAMREADLIIKEAQLEAEKAVRSIKANAMKLRNDVQDLKRQREGYLARMKMLVESHAKFIDSAEEDFSEEDSRLESELEKWAHEKGSTGSTPEADRRVVEKPKASPPPGGLKARAVFPGMPPQGSEASVWPDATPDTSGGTEGGPEAEAPGSQSDTQASRDASSGELGRETALNSILDQMAEGQKAVFKADIQDQPTPPTIMSRPSGEAISKESTLAPREVATAASDRTATAAPSAPTTVGEADAPAPRKTSKWSLEKLKRDILSRSSSDDEAT